MLNIKLQSIYEVLRIALKKIATRKLQRITVFLNFLTTIKKIQKSKTRIRQVFKGQIVKKITQFQPKNSKVTI